MFNVQLIEGETLASHADSLKRMKELGLPVVPFYYETDNADDLIGYIREIGTKRPNLPFDIDGAVVKVDNFTDRETLGSTSKFPNSWLNF